MTADDQIPGQISVELDLTVSAESVNSALSRYQSARRACTGAADIAQFLAARLDEDNADARTERAWADVAAKREHLRMYVQQQGMLNHVRVHSDQFTHDTQITAAVSAGVLEAVVRQDASVYSDHPDYNPAWRVQ